MSKEKVFDFIPPHHHHRKKIRNKRWGKRILLGVAALPVLYLLASAAVFIGLRTHLTDVEGVIDPQSSAFDQFITNQQPLLPLNTSLPVIEDKQAAEERRRLAIIGCEIDALGRTWPKNAARISSAKKDGVSTVTLERMLFAIKLRLPSEDPLIATWKACAIPNSVTTFAPTVATSNDLFPWLNTPEWNTVDAAFRKDVPAITKVSTATGIEPRLLVSVTMVEQLRLYFTQREVFKRFFEPLKVLGNATQFAWGVMAIKEATAIDIEHHLKDKQSPWYLGSAFEGALDYRPGADQNKERFARLTNEKDHSWSYLYGSLELKQFQQQWSRAKHPIDDRPEILATLFNIGFGRSHPSDHPSVGGSTLTIADTKYTFGALAYEWYYSGALSDVFPFPKNEVLPKP